MNSDPTRKPLISDAPADLQMAWSSYLVTGRASGHDLMSFEQWNVRRTAGGGTAVSKLSPGTTRFDPQPKSVVERVVVPQAPAAPVSTVALGHRHVGDGGFPRHGEPMPDEILHPVTGEPVTKATTQREDY